MSVCKLRVPPDVPLGVEASTIICLLRKLRILVLMSNFFAQALSSPISGILGDKYDRTHIVAFGCFLWGIMTTAIGFSTSIHQVLLSALCQGGVGSKFIPLFAQQSFSSHLVNRVSDLAGFLAILLITSAGMKGDTYGMLSDNEGMPRMWHTQILQDVP